MECLTISFSCLLTRRRRKERRPLCRGVSRQRAAARARESRAIEPVDDLGIVEALPHVSELNGVLGALVDHEVDEQELPAWFEYTLHFAHQRRRIGDEMRDEKEDGCVELPVLD